MSEKKIKVLQQVLDPSGSGGVSAEYRALQKSSLTDKYDFEPMILMNCHNGINIKDIKFYYKKIRESNPDIVHIRGAAPDGLNAVLAAKLARRGKILVTVHGMYSDLVYIHPLKRWISKHVIERLTFGLADGISCVCKAADQRDKFDKYRCKMLPVVYNRLPDYSAYDGERIRKKVRQELQLSEDTVVGLYVGRVTKEKGIEYLKTALETLDKQWPENFAMLIVGDGQYLTELQDSCEQLEHSENVICLGNQREVQRYLFASDFFVLPSLHENHSIALLEATAAGLPIVATDVGGNREIVKDAGILIESRNSNELLHAIKKMVDKDTRSTYRDKMKAMSSKEYTDAYIDTQLDEVYTRAQG